MTAARLLLGAMLAMAGSALADPAPPKVREAVERVAPALDKLFSGLLGPAPAPPPEFSVDWEPGSDSGPRVRTERTGDGQVRVRLSGDEWRDPPARVLATLHEALAREVAQAWRPSPDGAAELLGTAALLRLGAATPEETARHVNAAFNTCFAFSGTACAMPRQFVRVAAAQRRDPSIDAFAYFKSDAAQAVSADVPLVDALRDALGVNLPKPPADVYASQVLNNLMRHDCAGRFGFWTNNDHLFTDEVPGCGFFRGGWKLRYMAGRDLLKQPAEAVRAAQVACVQDNVMTFRTLDSLEFRMPCDAAVAALLPADLRVANLQPLRVARVLLRPN